MRTENREALQIWAVMLVALVVALVVLGSVIGVVFAFVASWLS